MFRNKRPAKRAMTAQHRSNELDQSAMKSSDEKSSIPRNIHHPSHSCLVSYNRSQSTLRSTRSRTDSITWYMMRLPAHLAHCLLECQSTTITDQSYSTGATASAVSVPSRATQTLLPRYCFKTSAYAWTTYTVALTSQGRNSVNNHCTLSAWTRFCPS